MVVQHELVETKGMFYINDNNVIVAKMNYSMTTADDMIIEHTEVSNELRGKQVGIQLINAAVEYARNHQFKIIPLCPYANSVFMKKPEFADVVKIIN